MKFTKTWQVALGGVLAAGSLAVLWLACVVPSGQLGVTAVAGLFPVGAVLAAGRGAGLLCWAAASILGLLLLPDKGVALMYLVFLGLYPVVKSRLEQLKSRSAQIESDTRGARSRIQELEGAAAALKSEAEGKVRGCGKTGNGKRIYHFRHPI